MKLKYSLFMNRKVLYLSTIVMVPLFLMFVSSGMLNIQDAEAAANQVTYQYGIRTEGIVCGDHLCNAEKTVTAVSVDNVVKNAPMHEHLPEIQIVSVHNFENSDPNAYVLTLKVTSGNQNLENISIQVQSDIATTSSNIGGLFADSDTKIVVRIQAMDASSIHASVQSYHLSE